MIKFKVNPNLTYKKISDQIIILDENRAEIRELNETASFIFLKLLSWTTTKEIAKSLANEYDIPVKQALKDTNEFVTMYLNSSFVTKKNV